MVTVADYRQRENRDGEPFYALILEGDIEMVQSDQTGKFYATAKRASMPSTFDEATCQKLIGKQMPGDIQKVDCEPYEFTIPDTGEVIMLRHRYEYVPEGKTTEEQVFAPPEQVTS